MRQRRPFLTFTLALLFCLSLAACGAKQYPMEITVVNRTTYPIADIRISLTSEEDWGENRLETTLAEGESTEIDLGEYTEGQLNEGFSLQFYGEDGEPVNPDHDPSSPMFFDNGDFLIFAPPDLSVALFLDTAYDKEVYDQKIVESYAADGDGRGDVISRDDIPVLMGGALPFTNMQNLLSENHDDGTYRYNHEAGRIGESAHPFTLRICPRDDMRFTVTIHETDFTNALISSLHEGGHALYGQNLAPELKGTTLAWGTSWGFDEGQARFFENFVGRSLPFWKYIFPMAQERFPLLKNTTAEEFYQNLNAVNCGPLRLYADELTYNLHIILRYELEKLYYDGKADVDELPELWNDKYEEYLGYRPKNDAEGILQDVHWFSGWIGYYQCYVLANCYDGHFLHSSMKDIPDFWEKVSRGEFDEINDWHNRKVRCTGNLYSPMETLYRFSGETLTAKHYIQYLKDKFEPLYGI